MSSDNPMNGITGGMNQAQNSMKDVVDNDITPQRGDNPVAGFATAPHRIIAGSGVEAATLATVGVETATNIASDPIDGLQALGQGLVNNFTPYNSKYKAGPQPQAQNTDTIGGKIDYAADGVAYQMDRGLETLTENLGEKMVGKDDGVGSKIGRFGVNLISAPFKLALGGIALGTKVVAHAVGGGAEVEGNVEHGVGQIFVGTGNLLSGPVDIKAVETMIGGNPDGVLTEEEKGLFNKYSAKLGLKGDRNGDGKTDRNDLNRLTSEELAIVNKILENSKNNPPAVEALQSPEPAAQAQTFSMSAPSAAATVAPPPVAEPAAIPQASAFVMPEASENLGQIKNDKLANEAAQALNKLTDEIETVDGSVHFGKLNKTLKKLGIQTLDANSTQDDLKQTLVDLRTVVETYQGTGAQTQTEVQPAQATVAPNTLTPTAQVQQNGVLQASPAQLPGGSIQMTPIGTNIDDSNSDAAKKQEKTIKIIKAVEMMIGGSVNGKFDDVDLEAFKKWNETNKTNPDRNNDHHVTIADITAKFTPMEKTTIARNLQ